MESRKDDAAKLARIEHDLEVLGANFAMLERLLTVLISTHPAPGVVATLMRGFEADAQLQQALATGLSPDVRAEAKRTAARLIDIADLTQQQLENRAPD